MVIGTSVMLLSLWSVVKTVLLDLFMRDNIVDFLLAKLGDSSFEQFRSAIFVIYALYTGSFLLLDLLLRVIVGTGARSEGLRKKSRWLYLVVCFLLVLSGIATLLNFFENEDIFSNDPVDRAIAFFIELTSDLMLLDLFISGIRVKLIRKELRSEAV